MTNLRISTKQLTLPRSPVPLRDIMEGVPDLPRGQTLTRDTKDMALKERTLTRHTRELAPVPAPEQGYMLVEAGNVGR